MHWKLIVVAFIMTIIGAIYPIINFVITNDFLTEFRYNVQELSLVYSLRGVVALNYAANYMRMSLNIQELTELKTFVDSYLVDL